MKKPTKKIKLSQLEKILLTMYELSRGTRENLKFEDIVVGLFKKYPQDFHLRGYPKYPDSELVEKAIYSRNLKRYGLINYGNKNFSLTNKGIITAKRLEKNIQGKKLASEIRFSRHGEEEISRIKSSDAFVNLFLTGKKDKILDTDFYDYLGVTVRTGRNDFLGRLKTIEDSVKELSEAKEDPLYEKLAEYHKFMLNKFQDIIEYKSKN